MDKEKVIKFLESLGISTEGEFDENRYIVELKDSDEWARYYSVLAENPDFELSEASSMSQEFASVITYVSDEYRIGLNANFDDNYYTISVEEN